MMMAGQSTPHSLFVLDKKRTGRGRSKRKIASAGRSAQSASLRPPAREDWPFLVVDWMKRVPPGETFGPGRARIPLCSLSAGAGRAVNAGRRGRRPLQDDVCRGGPVCPPVVGPPSYPRRGGCPHPPALPDSHQLPGKAQADLERQSFRQPPRGLNQTGNRGARLAQLSSPA